mgnify:CR=1 FL=1
MDLPKQALDAVRNIIPDSFLDRFNTRFCEPEGTVKLDLTYNEIFLNDDREPQEQTRKIIIFLDDQPLKEDY